MEHKIEPDRLYTLSEVAGLGLIIKKTSPKKLRKVKSRMGVYPFIEEYNIKPRITEKNQIHYEIPGYLIIAHNLKMKK